MNESGLQLIDLKAVILNIGVVILFRVANFWKRVAKPCQEEYYSIQNDQARQKWQFKGRKVKQNQRFGPQTKKYDNPCLRVFHLS